MSLKASRWRIFKGAIAATNTGQGKITLAITRLTTTLAMMQVPLPRKENIAIFILHIGHTSPADHDYCITPFSNDARPKFSAEQIH
jgi:hypothetical protein